VVALIGSDVQRGGWTLIDQVEVQVHLRVVTGLGLSEMDVIMEIISMINFQVLLPGLFSLSSPMI
jgi:hypothetical protein